MIAWMRIAVTAAVLVTMTLLVLPLQALAIRSGWPLARRLPLIWHRVACRIVGIRVIVTGEPSRRHPLLMVSNHLSWSDILVLGSVMELSFIAKAEVRGWPVFGLLARLQRTVFVERSDRRATGRQADAIAERLAAGDVMVLFAEGTTSDGNSVLPFKTALFGAAQSALRNAGTASVAVQPVALAYLRANGLPLGRFGRPLVAWPGDVELLPHLVGVLREGAVDVEVCFGDPIEFTPSSDRKAVARLSEERVGRMLAEALAGRPWAAGTGGEPARQETLARRTVEDDIQDRRQ
ncbi:lysophospholipid acyltransferase family protein [Mangrovicella endophytica]|uniref:lysophospholipid acyltransferase family protein n=1 Tax=Mangrovicella endophytica TaxID=2066697 RepID=UPI000C9DC103|nr:lysophospholipid acyltransferase family protein [Mangrovicella endophytica]